jgi:hypothetical protein
MPSKQPPGRPPKKPLDVDILTGATIARFGTASSKRTNLYRQLVHTSGLKDRTIREAFAGMATDDTRAKLENALGIQLNSLRKEQLDVDAIFSQLNDYRALVSQRMRYMDESQIRHDMPLMTSISTLLEQIVAFTATAELTPQRKLIVFETLHENLAYRHLAFDSHVEEQRIQGLVKQTLPAALQLRLDKRLSDDHLARLDASIGELWTNSTLPSGDVWKRDQASRNSAIQDAAQHVHAEAFFRTAGLFTTTTANYYRWRCYLSMEARARIFAKSGMAQEAEQELRSIHVHLDNSALDDAMNGDVNMINGMVARATGRKRAAIAYLEKAHASYSMANGADHHLTHALPLYLQCIDPAHQLSRRATDSIDFFRSSPFNTHWIIDVSKVKRL